MAIDFADLALRTNYSEIDRATTSLDKLSVASGRSEGAARSMGGAWDQIGRQIRAASQTDADFFGAKLAATHTKAAAAAEGHAFATNKVSRALESMIIHATGANHQVSQLTVAMADFGYGSAVVTGALAGLAALAFAYELITKNAREATKAQDDAIKLLNDRFKPETGKGSAVNDAFDLARERQREDSRKIDILRNSKNDFDVASGYRDAGFSAPFRSRDEELIRVTKDLAEANRAVALAIAHGAGSLPSVTVTSEDRQHRAEAERQRLARDRERSEKFLQDADADKHRTEDLTRARQLNLVPESVIRSLENLLTPALVRAAAAAKKLTDSFENAKDRMAFAQETWKGGNIMSGIQSGATGAMADIATQFSPANLAYGGVTSAFNLAMSGVTRMFSDLLGSGKELAEQWKRTVRDLALAAQSFHALATGNSLEADLASAQERFNSRVDQINAGMLDLPGFVPGSGAYRDEKRRQLEQAAADEALIEDRIRRQHAHDDQYSREDLGVRNLRALGRGDEADRLAFREQQEREMQKAIDENRDATYLSYLATVQNNELIAYQNGLLEDAVRNSPNGFRIDPYLYDFQTPRGYPTDSGAPISPLSPVDPTGGLRPGNGPPPNRGPVTIQLTVDGKVLTAVVIDNIDQAAAARGGSGSSRAEALEYM